MVPRSRVTHGSILVMESHQCRNLYMRYSNPLGFAEDVAAADLLAGGRIQLGVSRGSPEQVIDGWRYFGFQPA